MKRKSVIALLLMGLGSLGFLSCLNQAPSHFTHEVLNPMTPIKDQGKRQTCWVYAMLAAIETEHLRRGDSVNLSPAFIEQKLQLEPACPESQRGMGVTLLRLIQKHGIVGFDAMRTPESPAPRWVFMLGATYTPQEFARSVCAPDEYLALTSTPHEPYGQKVLLDLPDNWLRDSLLNVHPDTLLALTQRAVLQGRGVCWESKGHAMAIVGIAHDEANRPYFIMKNSWGTSRPHGGLDYLSFDKFRKETLAVELPRDVK